MSRPVRLVLVAVGALFGAWVLSACLPWRPYARFPEQLLTQPSAVLFVMAHHDDELVRIVRMHRLAVAGHEIHALWLAQDHYHTSIEAGRSESRCAMELAGVPPDHLHYLHDDVTDGGSLLDQLPLLVTHLTALLRELRPAAIFVNAYEGGHLEHDAAHVAAVLAASRVDRTTPIYEFPFYNAGGAHWPYYQVMTLLPPPGDAYSDYPSWSELLLLLRSAACFESQAVQVWGMLAAANLKLLAVGMPLGTVTGYDYTAPPHPGRLNYEGLGWYAALVRALPSVGDAFVPPGGSSFADFRAAYRAAADRLEP